MNTKDLIEAVKFQVSVKPQDDFVREVAEGLEKLYEENNRQKAEIERLHKEVGYWEAETKEARADIDQAVAEAIKEFAERLKKRFESWSSYSGGLIFANIDILVKEMVGDTE